MIRRRSGLVAGALMFLGGLAFYYLPGSSHVNFYLFLISKAAAVLLSVAGLNIALGYTGLFSFAHVSLYAMGAYATSIAVTDHGLPVWAGFVIAVAVGTIAGALLSLATFRARATSFAVVSLVLMFAVYDVLNGWDSLTHGEVGIPVRLPEVGGQVLGPHNYWLLTLIVVSLGMLAVRNLIRSPLGRGLVAVRESEAAAASVGVNPSRYRMLALAFGGAVAALGGALFAHLSGYVSPELAAFAPATLLVVSLLVGGPGTLWGPVVGVAFFVGVDRGLIWLQDRFASLDIVVFQQLISALILFAVIVFLPGGVAGTVRRWTNARRRRSRASETGRVEQDAVGPVPEEMRAGPAERTAAATVPASLPAPRTPARTAAPVLVLAGLTRSFGGVRAVDGLDLTVQAATIHGLIGPNGSGKTTTVNLITGALRADEGEVRFLEETLERPRPHRMAARGMGRVFQRAEVFGAIPAVDNVLVGFHLAANRNLVANLLKLPGARRREAALRAEARALLEAMGLEDQADMPATALPYGERRLLEIARALATSPTLLILDEPATGLSSEELVRLGILLRELRSLGVAVLLIEHNMEFLMDLCDRVSVLDYGRKIAEGTPSEVQSNPRVMEAYLGVAVG